MDREIRSRPDASRARNRLALEAGEHVDASKCRSFGEAMLTLANASTRHTYASTRNMHNDWDQDSVYDDVSISTAAAAVSNASTEIANSALISRLLIEEAVTEAERAARDGVTEFKSTHAHTPGYEKKTFAACLASSIMEDDQRCLTYSERFGNWFQAKVKESRKTVLQTQVEEQRRKLQTAIAVEHHNRIRNLGQRDVMCRIDEDLNQDTSREKHRNKIGQWDEFNICVESNDDGSVSTISLGEVSVCMNSTNENSIPSCAKTTCDTFVTNIEKIDDKTASWDNLSQSQKLFSHTNLKNDDDIKTKLITSSSLDNEVHVRYNLARNENDLCSKNLCKHLQDDSEYSINKSFTNSDNECSHDETEENELERVRLFAQNLLLK